MQKKLVILDRDGVVNHDSDAFIKSPDEWIPIPGSLEAIARLNQAGYRVVIASNQSGIGRGLFDMATLNEIHEKMHRNLAALGGRVDAIFFCPHTPTDHCDCRKPKPGLLAQIIRRFEIDAASTPVVGDSLRDLQAGAALGFSCHLVLTGKGQQTLDAGHLPAGTTVYADLHAFALDFLAAEAN
ncbi:D-glycero-beta-D-manno-heptose 1,7-bisphosphate 7-phosphatase [Mycetohabitans rhizoxinica]|jgi:D-glycero-D-manno-heptose 1,7-bisphosphate phosphatase|uniref:D,D-heptose 1,7-bisphosphate phosphatase n=1 Tax=Mycetohabitans rhizoxinica TaxID=412963 RepID=A0ABZ2PU94_9BURK|nr:MULTISPECIES: D-glycero-beta-D-manno-heptose 1,7-bisphosphate 7-phosphatase [unclassified Mycetohabitans]MCF7696547.1 D-glycero-beta-D-manno-heptose 1,7-bisphosphate 7-phosphatase [Mycetohabitans sp. B2]MCG1047882.1 D-glycero-beta-D-manno-heptose 1,7-bisphosphate 7-phosphatase [Mycetohabitans sp. B6]